MQIGLHLGKLGQKTNQKQSKIIVSAGTKTFESPKPINCKCHVNETYVIYVPP